MLRTLGCTFLLFFVMVSGLFLYNLLQPFDIEDALEQEVVDVEDILEEILIEEIEEAEAEELAEVFISKEDNDIFMYSFMGKSKQEIYDYFGQPDRVEPSAYDYDWHVYSKDPQSYFQVGIKNDVVVTIFCIGENIHKEPFQIGSSFAEIVEILNFEENISFNYKKNSYRFEINSEEVKKRPLIQLDQEVWAQLYFDTFTNKLSSVRYVESETLLKKRPYSIVYRGELFEAMPLSEKEWEEVELANARQIFDITNVIRIRHELAPLQWDESTAKVAYKHSKDMFMNDYFSHTSPTFGELSDRFENGNIRYRMAGENIAAKYVDGIAAVEGWLNSEGHRVNLLSEDFTHLGVGVFEKYYTQNFMTPWP